MHKRSGPDDEMRRNFHGGEGKGKDFKSAENADKTIVKWLFLSDNGSAFEECFLGFCTCVCVRSIYRSLGLPENDLLLLLRLAWFAYRNHYMALVFFLFHSW